MKSVLFHIGALFLAVLITATAAAILYEFMTVTTAVRGLTSSDYGPALDKAKDAALIQSGINSNLDKLGVYITAEGYAVACTVLPPEVIDTSVFLGAVAYRKRLDVRPFQSPILPGARHQATVTPDSVSLSTSWSF